MKPYITDALQGGRFVLPFQIEGIPADQVGTSFDAASVVAYGLPKSQALQAAWLFRLVLDTGWILDFSSACTGVGGWQEIGSLNLQFARTANEGDAIEWVMNPLEDFRIASVERLVFEDEEVYAESGISFKDARHREIIVAAGTAPGSVTVALPSSPDLLQSEFELDQLQRRPL